MQSVQALVAQRPRSKSPSTDSFTASKPSLTADVAWSTMPPATRLVRAAGDCLRVERFRVPPDLLPELLRVDDFFADDFRPDDRLEAPFEAEERLLFRAPPFLPALRFDVELPPRFELDFRAPPVFEPDFRAPPFFAADLRAPPLLEPDFRAPPFFAPDLRAPPFLAADERPDFFAELRPPPLLDFLEERFFVAIPDLLQELIGELQTAHARTHFTVHDRGHVVRVREVLR